uniref:Peroxidase n=1 Tax=Timema douglasi TaxID=61478 RepID=A0A7R8ZAQ1_TIMDO|nr:unnamed protein product [Timema douglasi]
MFIAGNREHVCYPGSQRLSEVLKRPFNLYKPGWYDQYVLGLINQVAQSMDSLVTQEVTNHLFQRSNQPWGMDLASINLQRAREHGVPGYNQFREWCGLTRMDNFSSLLHVMANSTVHRYNDMYDHPDDIDLWSAGVAENSLPGSMVGPTFNCIIARTFKKLKIGDRFWYENKNLPNSFTPDQLSEIQKVRLSRLLCDTSDEVETIQIYSMVLPDPQLNPRVSCKSKILHQLDLSKWKEDYPAKQNQDQKLTTVFVFRFCFKEFTEFPSVQRPSSDLVDTSHHWIEHRREFHVFGTKGFLIDNSVVFKNFTLQITFQQRRKLCGSGLISSEPGRCTEFPLLGPIRRWRAEAQCRRLQDLDTEDLSLWRHLKGMRRRPDLILELRVAGGLASAASDQAEALAVAFKASFARRPGSPEPKRYRVLHSSTRQVLVQGGLRSGVTKHPDLYVNHT